MFYSHFTTFCTTFDNYSTQGRVFTTFSTHLTIIAPNTGVFRHILPHFSMFLTIIATKGAPLSTFSHIFYLKFYSNHCTHLFYLWLLLNYHIYSVPSWSQNYLKAWAITHMVNLHDLMIFYTYSP